MPAEFSAKMLPEVGFIMLDHILGKYAVMTNIGDTRRQSILVARLGTIPLAC